MAFPGLATRPVRLQQECPLLIPSRGAIRCLKR